MAKTKVICFTNNKGGSGKTTTCSNVGFGLRELGKKVLMIDGDMQLNLSLSLFDEDTVLAYAQSEKNLYEAIKRQDDLTDYIVNTKYEGLDLIPSSTLMSSIEYELFTKWQREYILKKGLKKIRESEVYEYILLTKIDDVPCFLETTYLDCERYPDFEKYYTDKTSMGRILKNVYHRKQISGEEHISVTYASEQEAALLEIIPDSPLFFTSGVVKDEEGVIIMYYKQLIRGDKFKLVSRIESE